MVLGSRAMVAGKGARMSRWIVGLWLALMAVPAWAAPSWEDAWPGFSRAEGAATVALAGSVIGVTLANPETKARWKRPILADDAVRRALVARTRDGRERAAAISDVLETGMIVWPLTDVAVAGSYGARSNGAAGPMLGMAAESELIALLGNRVVTLIAGRERPYGRGCDRDPDYTPWCGSPDRTRSFFSGHTALSFAGAGLVCANHGAMPLYGGGAADPIACGIALGVATTVGTLRIVSDRHYLSDVVVGGLFGFAAGWVLPKALHYGFGSTPPVGTTTTPTPGSGRRTRVITFTVPL